MGDNNETSLRHIAKVELHAHLNGSLGESTLRKLAALKPDIEMQLLAELDKVFFRTGPVDLASAFGKFPIIQRMVDTPEAVKLATEAMIHDFAVENTVYLEIRSTPKVNADMTKTQYINAMIDGIKAMSNKHPETICRILISFDRRRGVHDAQSSLQAAFDIIATQPGWIVGIDMSGPPEFDGRQYLDLIKEARQAGLKTTFHLAETPDCLEELMELLPHTDRIGHATFLSHQPDAYDYVYKNNIPIELCLTSNVLSKTVPSYKEHHIKNMLFGDKPLKCVLLCTDDFGIFETSLTNEYNLALTHFEELSLMHIKKFNLDAIEHSFATDDVKDRISKVILDSFDNLHLRQE